MKAREKLAAAEAQDNYREACANSYWNNLARKGHVYEPFFVKPTVAMRMQEYSREIPLLEGASVIVLHPTADGGFPHTRAGSVVCMPSGFCESTAPAELKKTLIHESIHLHQREYGAKWASFCQKEGWTEQPDTAIPAQFQETIRINPDTMATPFWSWQTYYVPLPLFVPKPQLGLGDVSVKWLDLRNEMLYPDPPASFVNRFGTAVSQSEHPYEIYAVDFAEEGLNSHQALLERFAR
jgi:hypothetical protein